MRHPKILTTMKTYTPQLFAADVVAGLTVAMVALPLSLAIAIASGATPAQGLITAIVGGFFVSLLGGSRVQIGGPTGAFIVVVFNVISEHGYDGLVLATLMAGLILLTAAVFRAGRLIAYVPGAVVNGFTIGIALVIAISQLKDLLGLAIDSLPADFLEKVPVLWSARDSLNPSALMISLLTLALIVVIRRLAPRFPGQVVAIGIASVIVAYAGLPVDTVASKFGDLPAGLPMPSIPEISVQRISELFPVAMVIAFLAGVESLLSAVVADRMIEGKHRPNAEVLAQGAANIASALFGGMPATGAIARTAANAGAGAKTPVAGIVHALVLLALLMFAAPLAGYLAMPALAALLILTAIRMSDPSCWGQYLRGRNSDKFLLLTTLFLTVVVDLTVAIGVGVVIGLAIRLQNRKVGPAVWQEPNV